MIENHDEHDDDWDPEDDIGAGTVVHRHLSISGPTEEKTAFLTMRYVEEVGPGLGSEDYWLSVLQSVGARTLVRIKGSPSNIWVSDQGWIYLPMATGAEMWRYRDVVDDPAGNRETFPLPFAPRGVFGLSDTDVYAWGTKKRGTDDYVHQVAHFDGTDWKLMPDVPFWFHGMHGCDPSCLYGVAPQGILHWDGGQWTPIPSPTNEGLNSVFVESEKEVYIAGEGGSLMEGSAVGFGVAAQLPAPIYGAAKFKGELYVGAGPLGLFRRKGNTDELEIFKDKVKAVSFSARENWLTMTCPDKVVFSADGVRFRSKGADFSQVTSHRDPRDP